MTGVPWEPPEQPAWVGAANRGEIVLFADTDPLDEAELRRDALARAGHDLDADHLFGSDDFRAPLKVAVSALEAEARLTPLGRWATRRYLSRLLDVRLQLEAWQTRAAVADPAQADQPVFVIGAPRTGTTVVHRLLASMPTLRAPEGWELLRPLPPPVPNGDGTVDETDPRLRLAASELEYPQMVSGTLTSIHAYSARMPKECLSAMSFSFRSEEFISRYDVPSYAAWLGSNDLLPAYQAHRNVLEVLSHHDRHRHWVLKSPVHLQGIPELVATYPNARYVITHRDPAAVLASVSSLVCTLRSAFSDAVDPHAVGRYHAALYAASLDRLVDHVDTGLLPADRTVHVHHRDVITDSAAAVGDACEQLGLDTDSEALQTAAAEDRSDALGHHRYDAADYGLDGFDDSPFDRYRERFGVHT